MNGEVGEALGIGAHTPAAAGQCNDAGPLCKVHNKLKHEGRDVVVAGQSKFGAAKASPKFWAAREKAA